MKKKILICLILISFMLSGCTKQLKDSDGKVVQNELTDKILLKIFCVSLLMKMLLIFMKNITLI